MLEVILYGYDPTSSEVDPFIECEAIEIPFVSLVNEGTHGPPALVAPRKESGVPVKPKAQVGQSVLYINTSVVPAFRIKRLRDSDA